MQSAAGRGLPHNHTSTETVLKLRGQVLAGHPLCDNAECGWKGIAIKSLEMAAKALTLAHKLAANGGRNDCLEKLQGKYESILEQNKTLAKANRELIAPTQPHLHRDGT